MDNAITDLLDAIIPELNAMLSDMRFWLGFALLIGPLLLIAFGLYYSFCAPAEANHKMGYRTHYGMGSVAAWKFTQALAGKVWTILGGALAVVGIIGCTLMAGGDSGLAVTPALIILIIEAVAVITGYIVIETTVAGRYDENGNLKKK